MPLPESLPEITSGGSASETYDLVIVGCGPAGLTAADEASRRGLRVALMDPAIGGHSSVSAAKVLGTLASASALVELLVSGFFGRLSDAVGRKSTLVLVPLVAVLSRAAVVAFPSVPMLIVARFVTSASVPIFWLSFQASLADTLGRNATRLAIEQSRISAALGLGFAASTFVGGSLASRSVRLAYGCSCALGLSVVALVSLFFRETLPPSRRRPLGCSWASRSTTTCSSPSVQTSRHTTHQERATSCT